MRFLLACAVMLLSTAGFSQNSVKPADAAASAVRVVASADFLVAQARKQAQKENKNVLVLFHASWCGWCKKMERALDEPEIRPLFEKNYVTVWLTVDETPNRKADENSGAKELLQKYKGYDLGIPYFLIFDPAGNLVADSQKSPGENIGCPAQPDEVAYFVSVLRRTAKLSETELQQVADRFKKNKG